MTADITTPPDHGTDDDESLRIMEMARNTVEQLHDSAHVDRVYGDPVTTDRKTIVPVARVAYGFAGGIGSGTDEDGEVGEGGGGIGGAKAVPIGVVEITDERTRFVRWTNWKRLALAVGAGFILGRRFGRQ